MKIKEERYVAAQLLSIVEQNIAVMKFGETESLDGTVQEVREDPLGDYLVLSQHEGEKIRLADIEEIYLLKDGYLPIYYSPLNDYDKENTFYPSEFFEAFDDFVGEHLKLYGKFGNLYEIEGLLTDVRVESLQLFMNESPIDLWRVNLAFEFDEATGNWRYISPEDMADTFEDPLDNLYSAEDFEMLVGKKIRIKTMDPEIQDEVVNVSGYTMAEGYTGQEVCHLELEEFPDHVLEPSEIQFIYLIGEDGSETLVEPSGGSLYEPEEEENDDDYIEEKLIEEQFFNAFLNAVPAELKPIVDEESVIMMGLKISKEDFKEVSRALCDWYESGTPATFNRTIAGAVKVFDSRQWNDWYTHPESSSKGYARRPHGNPPVIILQTPGVTKNTPAPGPFAFYSLADIDKLNETLGLGLKNNSYVIGSMYEAHASKQIDPLAFYKSAVLNFKKHLKLYPRHALALNHMGHNLHLLGKFEEALAYFNQALEVFPGWTSALSHKTEALMYTDRFGEALETAAAGQQLEAKEGEWPWHMARIYERMGDKVRARKYAEEAVQKGFAPAGALLSAL